MEEPNVTSSSILNLTLEELIPIFGKDEYIDKNGIKWKVKSNGTIDSNCKIGTNYSTAKTNYYSKHFKLNRFYYHNERRFKEIEVSISLKNAYYFGGRFDDKTTYISFFYGHDLRIKILTLRGKPQDLSKYTIDHYKYKFML